MNQELVIYNSLTGKKEVFKPIVEGKVGMYVCGPTVYGDPHLGNTRPVITFDVVSRYLRHIGNEVTYVRNITDVGHLENDADDGEDKIGKKAREEKVEPIEIARHYTAVYHDVTGKLNALPPDIEPRATDHIQEQIEMVQQIIKNGYAYEVNGSVYFDLEKYYKNGNDYGKLSGRVVEDMLAGSRELDGQDEKRSALDFALWKKASPSHIMRWPSPWSDGYPGWHLECSAMSTKYLGKQFDIHGGGMDLKFPHHEAEIAQCKACDHSTPVNYWMHNNMITINGQKMGKSLGNFITLQQLYDGNHELLERAYAPMTIRFFVLQAHYRGTLDFSNEALQAAQKGFNKLINAYKALQDLTYSGAEEVNQKQETNIINSSEACYKAINDDFNTAQVIANLFNLSKTINAFNNGNFNTGVVTEHTFNLLKETFNTFVITILGLKEEMTTEEKVQIKKELEKYSTAKEEKNYDVVDQLRAHFKERGLVIRDMKHKIDWAYEE